MADSSLVATAVNIFTSPGEAFPVIKARPRPAFPLLIFIALVAVVAVVYILNVDLQWMIENQIRASAAADTMNDTAIEQAAERSARTPGFIAAVGAIGSAVSITVVFLVYSLYLWIAAVIAKHGIRFIQAFALTCWCALPGLLGLLASLVNIFVNDATFMTQQQINPLSFAALVGLDATQMSVLNQTLAGLDLTTLWTTGLMVLGYKAWSGTSIWTAAAIVLGPYVFFIALAFAVG